MDIEVIPHIMNDIRDALYNTFLNHPVSSTNKAFQRALIKVCDRWIEPEVREEDPNIPEGYRFAIYGTGKMELLDDIVDHVITISDDEQWKEDCEEIRKSIKLRHSAVEAKQLEVNNETL